MNVGVIGYAGNIDEEPIKSLKNVCEELGKAIAKKGHVLVSGGRDGIMELVSKSAKEAWGVVVGILPGLEKGNDHLSFGVSTGMDFSMRSILMMYNVDVVISVGGKAGTALELFAAYGHSIPTFLLRGTGGWTDRIVKNLIEGKYLDERKNVELKSVWSVEEFMKEIEKMEEKI